jgi:hypothetical protein
VSFPLLDAYDADGTKFSRDARRGCRRSTVGPGNNNGRIPGGNIGIRRDVSPYCYIMIVRSSRFFSSVRTAGYAHTQVLTTLTSIATNFVPMDLFKTAVFHCS